MTILVTGANRGIGRAILEAAEAAGRSCFGTSRAEPRGGWLKLDVTDPASIAAAARDWGDEPLRTLVCNAGVYEDKGEALDSGFDADLWARTFAVNVTGVFLTIQAFLPMIEAAGGKIAIISSQMGSSERANGGSYIYRASKAAAVNLGRNLAVDLKPKGIAVGIYHPGWVRTDMGGEGANLSPEESGTGILRRIEALDLSTTGTFESWDGTPLPF